VRFADHPEVGPDQSASCPLRFIPDPCFEVRDDPIHLLVGTYRCQLLPDAVENRFWCRTVNLPLGVFNHDSLSLHPIELLGCFLLSPAS
jgi:hypothetical protein